MLCCGSDIITRLLLMTAQLCLFLCGPGPWKELNYRAISEFLFCSLVDTPVGWVLAFHSFVPS